MGNNKYKESKVKLGIAGIIAVLLFGLWIYGIVVCVKDWYKTVPKPVERTYVLETENGSTSYMVKSVVSSPDEGTPSVTYYCADGINFTFHDGNVVLRDNVNDTTTSYSNCSVYPKE